MGYFLLVIALSVIALCGKINAGDTKVTVSEFIDESKVNGSSFYLSKDALFNSSESSSGSALSSVNVTESNSTASLVNSTASLVNTTDISRIGVLNVNVTLLKNETEVKNETSEVSNVSGNITDSYHEEHEDVSEDLTVTDASGCFTAKRDQLEERCYNKFEDVILHVETEDEAQRRKEVCCAVEDYEKCSLNGFKTTNCGVDHKELKETLKAARIFMGAMTNISCSEHRGMCAAAASATYASGFLMMVATVVAVILF